MNVRDTSNATYAAFEYICDMFGSDMVLNELFDRLSLDDAVSFLHDFMDFYEVDTSDLDDDCIKSLNEHYRLHC